MRTKIIKGHRPEHIKRSNRLTILMELWNEKFLSVSELSIKSGLSHTTIHKCLLFLKSQKLIVSIGHGDSSEEGGKPPEIYQINDSREYFLTIHISSSKINVGIFSVRPILLGSLKKNYSYSDSLKTIWDIVIDLTDKIILDNKIDKKNIKRISVALPGLVNHSLGIWILNPWRPDWGKNINVISEITKKLNINCDVIVDNEFRFIAQASKKKDCLEKEKNFVLFGAGEGLGSGIISEGKLKRGSHFFSGEIGHMIIEPNVNFSCACGGVGCFESLLLIPRVIEKIVTLKNQFPSSILSNLELKSITIQKLFEAWNSNDQLAVKVMEEIVEWFSRAISNLIVTIDPDAIFIYGIYTEAGDLFLKRLRNRIQSVFYSEFPKEIHIRFSKLDELSALWGGAYNLTERLIEDINFEENK
ncbi:ROK family protein [Leptospira sp. GIMC2001]|uniref:ROK family protein n=1 Tax=Leptospira sp. GIMC2001 TaxID=1513297 RepID=UPI00234BD942|nr:ROK family protein [Leptospira sp. GIMC2001]WCL49338.1 ROK family protein [Leptospira sp. GIMC2001]